MSELKTVTCEKLMTTPLKPITYCIDRMISLGLFILAGEPKVGKSWLALEIALGIAKGENVLGRKTIQGTSLYFCLEDSYVRLQNRLFELTNEPTENLHLAIAAKTIGKGLEQQIEKFYEQHNDLKIVIIDTLQKIRTGDETSYALEYKELSVIKNLADELGIAIVIIHHTSKREKGNDFTRISGTTAITGCADGSFVMKEIPNGAEINCTGRDIESFKMKLKRNGARWIATETVSEKPRDNFSFMVHDFISEQKYFKGSATELAQKIFLQFGVEIPPNRITQHIVQHGYELQAFGVKFEIKRSHGSRFIILKYDHNGDSSDSCGVRVDTAVTAVHQSVESILTSSFKTGDGTK